MPSLFVIQGRDQGTRYQLGEPVHSVGRTQTNAIRLHDTEVSRNHAELVRRGEAYVVRDTGSSNGTFVNGRLIEEQPLKTGDQIQVGRSLLLYTGFVEERVEDISDQVDIVPRAEAPIGSRIVATLGQTGGSEWLLPEAGDSSNPWIARARSNLQIMYRTALAVSHTMDIDQLLTRIMGMIFDWVDADRGCIMLKDLETGRLTPKVRRHRRGVRGDEKISISKTILDYVVDHNEGVLTSDAKGDDRFDAAQSIVSQGIREAICVPMQGRYEVVGVIYIDTATTPQRAIANRGANQFTEEHLRLMIAIAHQAALAVEDTSYYKALVQAERLAAVGQTIASLSHHIKNILQGVRGGSYLIELGLQEHERSLVPSESPPQDAPQHAGPADENRPAGASPQSVEDARDGNHDDQQDAELHSHLDPQAIHKAFDTIRKGWGIVERNQERISALVMDMLTFSKEREPEPRPAHLNEVAADVVELMSSRAEELKVAIEWNPDPDLPILMFDPDGLHRAILNVVTNAIDASEENPHARVTVATKYLPHLKLAHLIVSDNGAGIAPDDIEAIFTVFVSRKGGRGTGLGLPVSRKILEEHGGQILVESTAGQGSRFTLELPAAVVRGEGDLAGRATQSIAPEDLPHG